MIPQKTTCLTTVHIGDSEWHGFFCRLQGSPRCPKKLSKTSKNNRGNRKREWEEGQVLVLISGGWWDVLAGFLRGWHGEFCSPTYFCHVVWPHSPPPGVLWFFLLWIYNPVKFFNSDVVDSSFKKRTLWMADGVKRVMFFSTGYFRSAPNTLLEKKMVPKTNPKATCRRDWSIPEKRKHYHNRVPSKSLVFEP